MVDASSVAVGGMLLQLEDGNWRPVSYFGAKLAKHQLAYTITEKECLAVVVGIKKYQHYLIGKRFVVVSDHHALCSLRKIEFKCTRLHRWANLLAQFHYTIEYEKGETHPADCFSRSTEWKHKKQGSIAEEDFYKYLHYSSEVKFTEIGTGRIIHIPDPGPDWFEKSLTFNKITNSDNCDLDSLDEVEKDEKKLKIFYVKELINNINDKLQQPEIFDFHTIDKFILTITNPVLNQHESTIKEEQQKDVYIKRLIKQVKGGELKQKFTIRQDILYRRLKKGKLAIVLPYKMINQIYSSYHDDPLGGHFGLKPTLRKIKQIFWFQNMEEIIDNKIKKCIKCINYKPKTVNHEVKGTMPVPDKPFERIQIDIQGPFMPSKKRNQYLIVAADVLTRFAFAKAYPNQRTREVIDFLNCLTTFTGIPKVLQSDNGPCFRADQFAEYLEENGIKHSRSAPYRPQTQGLVERLNGIIGTRIKMFSDRRQDWDEKVREAVISYNSTPSENLGASPHELLFNSQPNNPLLNHLNISFESNEQDIQELRQKVREKLIINQEKRLINEKVKPQAFEVGDVVAKKVQISDPKLGKLTPVYNGTYIVIAVYNSSVKLINSKNLKSEKSNFINIKLINRERKEETDQHQKSLDFSKNTEQINSP